MKSNIEIFLSYRHQDEKFCQELVRHLVSVQRQQRISVWYDSQISPGNNWAEEINRHVNTARIILLLISPNYLASDQLIGREVNLALERQKEGTASVIPIILRPCAWQRTSIGKLQALPTNGKPVSSWSNQDLALVDITNGIRKIIDGLSSDKTAPIAENDTISAPVSVDEKRFADLEEKLHDCYLLIQNRSAFLRFSEDLEEREHFSRDIAAQWKIIESILAEYQFLVQKLGHSVPTEIVKLLEYFDKYNQKDKTEDLLNKLRSFSSSELRLLGFDLRIDLDVFLKENNEIDLHALLDYARQHSLMEDLTN